MEKSKKATNESNEILLPRQQKEKKQPWMTSEILNLMKERRKLKGRHGYKDIDTKIKKKCNEAQEVWCNEKCDEIETLSKKQ